MAMETVIERYVRYWRTFRHYSYLFSLLVKKDMKKKYRGSVLGVLWSLLNPLLYAGVLTLVFSTLFDRTIENFVVYLLSGYLLFTFFSSTTTSTLGSIIQAAPLIKKVYIPKYILPLSKIVSEFIFFLITLVVLFVMMLVTGFEVTLYIFYAPLYVLLLFVFSCGVGLILATVTVFFRDTQHLYGVLTTLLMYASAIFYPADIIPDKYRFVLTFNPIYHFIKGFRDGIYYGVPMDYTNLVICAVLAMVSLAAGVVIFERNQDRFILYI